MLSPDTEVTIGITLLAVIATGFVSGALAWIQSNRDAATKRKEIAALLLADVRRMLDDLEKEIHANPDGTAPLSVASPMIHQFSIPAIERGGVLKYSVIQRFLSLETTLTALLHSSGGYEELRTALPNATNNLKRLEKGPGPDNVYPTEDGFEQALTGARGQVTRLETAREKWLKLRSDARSLLRHLETDLEKDVD